MASTPSNLTRFSPSAMPARTGDGLRSTAGTPARPRAGMQARSRFDVFDAIAKEPEDARLTGGTRSLDRRLLALNLSRITRRLLVSSERTRAAIQSNAA